MSRTPDRGAHAYGRDSLQRCESTLPGAPSAQRCRFSDHAPAQRGAAIRLSPGDAARLPPGRLSRSTSTCGSGGYGKVCVSCCGSAAVVAAKAEATEAMAVAAIGPSATAAMGSAAALAAAAVTASAAASAAAVTAAPPSTNVMRTGYVSLRYCCWTCSRTWAHRRRCDDGSIQDIEMKRHGRPSP